jgi:hypothetical protein
VSANDLIDNLVQKFKVPDYQVINKFVYSNSNYFGLYWKYKSIPNQVLKNLRVISIFPDSRIRKLPFIPINASAKNIRFHPNIIQDSYKTKKSLTGRINIKHFGELIGQYDVFVYNPNRAFSFFDSDPLIRKFDLISVIKI